MATTSTGLRAGARELVASDASLVRLDDDTWRADRHFTFGARAAQAGHGRLDGGELAAHSLRIAEETTGYRCLSISSVFPKEGRVDVPVDYQVETMHAGRTMAFVNVGARQGDRVVGHSQVMALASTEGPSQQGTAMAEVGWGTAAVDADMLDMIDPPITVVGGVPIGDPGVGEPAIHLVLPLPAELTSEQLRRMYLLYALDHLMMAPALRPFEGIGYRTKQSYFTAVTAQSVRFWGDVLADQLRWSITSPVVADGVGITVAHGFDQAGRLVASCTQDLFARALG